MVGHRRIEPCVKCGAAPFVVQGDWGWYVCCTIECGTEPARDVSKFMAVSKWNELQSAKSTTEGETAVSGPQQAIPEPPQDCKATVERLEAWRSACRYLYEVLCKDGLGGKPMDCVSVGDYGRIAALLGKAETLEEKA
jgi:hypothetical protein